MPFPMGLFPKPYKEPCKSTIFKPISHLKTQIPRTESSSACIYLNSVCNGSKVFISRPICCSLAGVLCACSRHECCILKETMSFLSLLMEYYTPATNVNFSTSNYFSSISSILAKNNLSLLPSKSLANHWRLKDQISALHYQKKKKICCLNTHKLWHEWVVFLPLLLWSLQQLRVSLSLRQKHPAVCVAIIPCDMGSRGEGIGRLGGRRLGKGREEAQKMESNGKTSQHVKKNLHTNPPACISSRRTDVTLSWVSRTTKWFYLTWDLAPPFSGQNVLFTFTLNYL